MIKRIQTKDYEKIFTKDISDKGNIYLIKEYSQNIQRTFKTQQ